MKKLVFGLTVPSATSVPWKWIEVTVPEDEKGKLGDVWCALEWLAQEGVEWLREQGYVETLDEEADRLEAA